MIMRPRLNRWLRKISWKSTSVTNQWFLLNRRYKQAKLQFKRRSKHTRYSNKTLKIASRIQVAWINKSKISTINWKLVRKTNKKFIILKLNWIKVQRLFKTLKASKLVLNSAKDKSILLMMIFKRNSQISSSSYHNANKMLTNSTLKSRKLMTKFKWPRVYKINTINVK